MKVSLNQLKQYTCIPVSVAEFTNKMTMSGFEVESVENAGENIKNVVAAKIIKITPHENSDHLQICQMDVGAPELVQIVTGAQNIKENDFVPAALDNSYLPGGTHIVAGKLRGVDSYGMLCSGEELGLTEADYEGASVHGILILKGEPAPGTDIREVLGLTDTVIDFSITSNRPDCNCYLGLAREAGVVLNTEFKAPKAENKNRPGKAEDDIKVDVLNPELCERYMGAMVKNLRIKPSPEWMQKALVASGMRPINNIVDITNFVMLETGQPMHAFDYDMLSGKHIIVRTAKSGESITTLDGKKYDLTPDMLVIADGENPSCLAGIMGGIESEITENTKTLFLESAKFRRDNIRHTGRKLGIRTEASGRFEKGTDIKNTEYALLRALNLIEELDAGDVVGGIIDRCIALPEDKIITVTVPHILELIGVEVPYDTVVNILNKLGIKTEIKGDTLTCKVPSIRDDIEGRADLAEEIMRIYGYEHIVGTPMRGAVVRGKKLPERIKTDALKQLLILNSAYEISTYSFIASKAVDSLKLPENDERRNGIKLLNPLGDEYSVLRTQLVTSMLTVIATNTSRKITDARFFEVGKRFIAKQMPVTEQPDEIPTLCIGFVGQNEDFFTLKGLVEDILQLYGAHAQFTRSSEPFLHPGRQASVLANNTNAGYFGEVHPEVSEAYGIEGRVLIAEIKLDVLFGINKRKTVYKPLPKFPAVERDFALLCDADLPIGTLNNAIVSGASRLCEKVELFDVYTGSQIPAGKKSVAFSVWLRSAEHTLTDEEIEKATADIIKKLEAAGAELRK